MTRSTILLILMLASPTFGAPVPKEIRSGFTHVGMWQRVALDPADPAKRTPNGQVWIIAEDCNVTFHDQGYRGPPGRPTERLLFDPKTGHVDQSNIGGNGAIRKGRYKIEGDLLIINLNSDAASPRPPGVVVERNSGFWILQRVEDRK